MGVRERGMSCSCRLGDDGVVERWCAAHARTYRALVDALKPFAAINGVAAPRMMRDMPDRDRLWSYYESRTDTQHEITRAHIIEAARVLKLSTE